MHSVSSAWKSTRMEARLECWNADIMETKFVLRDGLKDLIHVLCADVRHEGSDFLGQFIPMFPMPSQSSGTAGDFAAKASFYILWRLGLIHENKWRFKVPMKQPIKSPTTAKWIKFLQNTQCYAQWLLWPGFNETKLVIIKDILFSNNLEELSQLWQWARTRVWPRRFDERSR